MDPTSLDKQEADATDGLFFEDLADLSKIRKQIQDRDYEKDRTKWAKYVWVPYHLRRLPISPKYGKKNLKTSRFYF